MDYPIAHSKNSDEKWHYLREHLIEVANMTHTFSSTMYQGKFGALAWLVGLAHDIGKMDSRFQEYLMAIQEGRSATKVPHAPLAAYLLYRLKEPIKTVGPLTVGGHHSGVSEIGNLTAKLANYELDSGLEESMRNSLTEMIYEQKLTTEITPSLNSLQTEMLIRMLFSALVDADRLDTERHFDSNTSRLRAHKVTLTDLAKRFKNNQDELILGVQDKLSKVSVVRNEVYQACLDAAKGKPGFYRLTVPTGGGKTRSSLAFALDHAIKNGLRGIFFAIPYTSIIDQTAQVYRSILGDDAVLEHHSQRNITDTEDYSEQKLRLMLAEENWDMPVIVTTNVQLLESLFSNSPSKCRKIHRLANSVIVFDEAQTLPVELLKPTLDALRDLVENYGSTVVLSTATQPALQSSYLSELDIKEIVPDNAQHFEQLRRVQYRSLEELLTMEALAEEVSRHEQVLVILNTRKSAVELVKTLDSPYCFHLSTLLCGSHRRKILQEVRQRLNYGHPIQLISTQVIEAGVDLDFPVVYRALGPLDRIVQAAGRCNREGKLDYGSTVIFELENDRAPKGPYKAGLEKSKLILSEYSSPEILHDPKVFDEYFIQLYDSLGNNLDRYNIQDMRERLNFPEVAARYRLIPEKTIPVLVRYGDYMTTLKSWEEYPSRETWRLLQPYLVSIYESEAKIHFRDGLLTEVSNGLYMWEGVYDEVLGLSAIQRDPSDLIT